MLADSCPEGPKSIATLRLPKTQVMTTFTYDQRAWEDVRLAGILIRHSIAVSLFGNMIDRGQKYKSD